MLVDSHAHLQDIQFSKDLALVIDRARLSGVEAVICISDRIESSHGAVRLATSFTGITASVGIHPHHADTWSEQTSFELQVLADRPEVSAVGEIGLDHHWPGYDGDRQIQCFMEQALVAAKLNKPIVVHCRNAYETLIDLLSSERTLPHHGVIHCFGGTADQAARLIGMGYYLGIGGSITYPSSDDLRELVKATGLERILIETDAPYLPPQIWKGYRNEPAFILDTLKILASSAGVSEIQAADQTRSNTTDLFGLNQAFMQHACEKDPAISISGRAEISLTAGSSAKCHTVDVITKSGPKPMLDWDQLIGSAREMKSQNRDVILNMDESALKKYKTRLADLAGLIDTLSIHMPDVDRLCCEQGQSWDFLADLTRECRLLIPDIIIKAPVGSKAGPATLKHLIEKRLKVRFMLVDFRDQELSMDYSTPTETHNHEKS